jgi:hypothetical protein
MDDWAETVGQPSTWHRIKNWTGWSKVGILLIGIIVGLGVWSVISGASGHSWAPWEAFEPFRAWNECQMHPVNIPYASNSCNRHELVKDGNPASLGQTYGVKLYDNAKDGCSCSCTCPASGQQQLNNLQKAGSNLLDKTKSTDLPSVNDLQSYAKNMWNSVITKDEKMAVFHNPNDLRTVLPGKYKIAQNMF